eukprot:CAMPEP_0119073964 /NCGR_PEP_ID=MMETSP1178-20130426/70450_1 /TAXON_ID=33656 /ORGANISM="unid sp, Strain CCMP2000" /LENGTH=128 /DNA_ID=CAMNT_0007056091 /DNA_START=46 /DNA_END=432 /DNA_ORIENTATION=+
MTRSPGAFLLMITTATTALRLHSGSRSVERMVGRAAAMCMDSLPQLPDQVEGRVAGAERSLSVNGETITLDELGPVVLQKDGRLGRLSNWHDMTEAEQTTALQFVAKRNAKRRQALLKAQAEEEPEAS